MTRLTTAKERNLPELFWKDLESTTSLEAQKGCGTCLTVRSSRSATTLTEEWTGSY